MSVSHALLDGKNESKQDQKLLKYITKFGNVEILLTFQPVIILGEGQETY